jgi:hypothetical protein
MKIEKRKIHKKTDLGVIFPDSPIIECPKCNSKCIHDIDFCEICGCVDRECLECGCTWTEFKETLSKT